jgi:circadian clock protein KaiC
MSEIERVKPTRMVFDSLSDLALLARDELSFRRELLRFKRLILRLKTTTLLMSDRTQPRADRHIHSLAHGVVELDERAPDYGTPKRRLRVRKLRGTDFAGGYHDFRILRGGLEVYPRLVAADQRALPPNEPLPTNLDNLDAMLGGGLARGASTLLMGPAGSGKSSLVALFARAALDVGDPAAAFLFDEESDLFLRRAAALGVSLDGYLESGQFELLQIDPGQISAGHFVHEVRRQITERGVRFIAIDSLNGYIHAMPDERFLVLQVHELLSYLARLGVATVLVLTQAGLVGSVTTPADITYVADAVMLTRFFEARGEVRRAVSMFKKRGGAHESTIRELRFDDGIDIGRVLTEFHGVLTGAPQFAGEHHELLGIDPRSSSD